MFTLGVVQRSVSDPGTWRCMVMCVHSEHLGLKHGAFCPRQIDLRKCPKLSFLGLMTGRPTCQN